MTVSHVWFFWKNTAGIPVFYRMHCLERFNLSCQQPSSYRRGLHLPVSNYMSIYWNYCIHIKQQLRLDSKRNRRRRRLETKRVEIFNKHIAYSHHRASNDIRATELLLNTIIMLPHIVYKLYVAVLFIYTKKTQTLPTRTTGADCPDEREIL